MDIEDIIDNNKDKILLNFSKDLACKDYKTRKEYDSEFIKLRKKYKINPKKTDIRKNIKNIEYTTESFLKYSLRKIGKSSSGVSVITVLTSPNPTYINYKGEEVEQSFTCGNDCAYCPNEPEQKLDLEIIDKYMDSGWVYYKLKANIDLKLIRIINHIIYDKEQYNVYDTFDFYENTFKIKTYKLELNIGEKIVGVKIAQPRSYISSEPAVLRAGRDNFDAIEQMFDRANVLNMMGHPIDKIEVIVLGGTWDHYPLQYRFEFVRDIYYSMNIYPYNNSREPLTLKEEIKLNEKANCRIIGLTTETRPDCITVKQIKNLRKMNITRVQLGVQHFDDNVLKFINRGCYLNDTIESNYILKQNGYKLDMHLMPDLPGSNIENDLKMYENLFSHKLTKISENYFKYELEYPELQADQLKIYPCSTVPYTKIKEWYDNGSYKPYSENKEDLIKVIMYIKIHVFPWIRLNRIIRDIPSNWIEGGNKDVSLRQYLLKRMKNEGLQCNCIRCREVSNKEININEAKLFIREYNGVNATEYFISYETSDNKTIYGFIRLRINHTNDNIYHKELIDNAFIRELHVYGSLSKHNEKGKNIQHKGFGKKLLKEAEKIVQKNNINKISIISGVGVREYYEKNEYILNENTQYMTKYINTDINNNFNYIVELIIISCIYILLLYIDNNLYEHIKDNYNFTLF